MFPKCLFGLCLCVCVYFCCVFLYGCKTPRHGKTTSLFSLSFICVGVFVLGLFWSYIYIYIGAVFCLLCACLFLFLLLSCVRVVVCLKLLFVVVVVCYVFVCLCCCLFVSSVCLFLCV